MDWRAVSGTHPVQVLCLSVLFATNTVVLAYLNERKRLEHVGKLARKEHSWKFKRGCFWVLILCALAVEIYLDTQYDIDVYFVHLKGYTFSWSVSLLDLYFSSTPSGVPMTCILGILAWVLTGMLCMWNGAICHLLVFFDDLLIALLNVLACATEFFVENYMGSRAVYVRKEFSLELVMREVVCYALYLPVVGAFSDVFFSPIHRLMHHPKIYKGNHKVHHEFVNQLTSLVQFHATLFDDLVMPLTVTLGRILMQALISPILPGFAVSNWVMYLNPIHQSFSHAHDVRCAHIIAPIPEGLNFSAYHYVHHLSPCNNYGLVSTER